MTYVTEQTPQELRAHMRQLKAMAGWNEPLADRLHKEVLDLDAEVKRLTATLAAQAGQSEPVAWRVNLNEGHKIPPSLFYFTQKPDGMDRFTKVPLYTVPAPVRQPLSCAWTVHDDDAMPNTFDSACGEVWTFTEGGPKENSFRFCHGCGKPVEITAQGAAHD